MPSFPENFATAKGLNRIYSRANNPDAFFPKDGAHQELNILSFTTLHGHKMSGSSSDLVGRSSYRYTHSSEQSQNRSTIETPSMNPHNDCISFLAVAQYYEVDFVFMTWETGRGKVGSGATSEIWQSSVSRRIDFAFKRTKLAERSSTDSQDEEKAYNAMVSEISVLRHPLIQHHQNIVNLEGICWEIPAQSEKVWPVLLLEKAQLGDLESFMLSAEGKAMTMHERLGICSDVANAIIALHSNGMQLLVDLFKNR